MASSSPWCARQDNANDPDGGLTDPDLAATRWPSTSTEELHVTKERLLAASLIIVTSAEAVFYASRKLVLGVSQTKVFLTNFMTAGLSGWRPEDHQSR